MGTSCSSDGVGREAKSQENTGLVAVHSTRVAEKPLWLVQVDEQNKQAALQAEETRIQKELELAEEEIAKKLREEQEIEARTKQEEEAAREKDLKAKLKDTEIKQTELVETLPTADANLAEEKPKAKPKAVKKEKHVVPKAKAKSRLKKSLNKESARELVMEAMPILEKPENLRQIQAAVRKIDRTCDEMTQMMNMVETVLPLVWSLVGHIFEEKGIDRVQEVPTTLFAIQRLSKDDKEMEAAVDKVNKILGMPK